MSGFRNPYTFVRTPARDTDAANPLGDARPGRHAGAADEQLLRGVVRYTITAISPLLLNGGDDGDTVRVPVDPEGAPVLAPTALKGMLRSGYEGITNSRYGVLDDSTSPLTFRRPAGQAEQQPARVSRQGGELRAVVVRSLRHAAAPQQETQAAPWVPFYRDRRVIPSMSARRHGEEVEAWLHLMQYARGRPFQLWRASDVTAPGELPATAGGAPTSQNLTAVPGCEPVRVRGYLLVTGRSFSRKHDERLVVTEVLAGPAQLEQASFLVDERVEQAWKAVVQSYMDIDARPAGMDPGAYVRNPGFLDLDGMCCFARVEGQQLLGLFPSMIGREAYPETVRERMHPSLRPARTIEELSPADRAFGWVAEASGPDRGVDAYRGHVWLGPVRCDSGAGAVQSFTEPWPLAALNGPKPSQARFYVGDEDGNPLPAKTATSGKNGYATGRRPRGRKTYWPRLDLPEDYWQGSRAGHTRDLPPPPRETGEGKVREHVAGASTSANVTRRVVSWVAPEATFSGEIRFDGLTRVEAGALLWLLTRPKHLMLGGGRPLGFGQVSLQPSEPVRIEVAPGGAEAGGAVLDVDSVVDCFLEAAGGSVSLRDFSTVSAGTSSAVHYPRSRYAVDAPSYEWFVFNENAVNRHTLPLPHGPELPYLENPRPGGRPGDRRGGGPPERRGGRPPGGGRPSGSDGAGGDRRPGPSSGAPRPGPPRDRPRPE